jgi:uncharacterized protein (DUF1778 family)
MKFTIAIIASLPFASAIRVASDQMESSSMMICADNRWQTIMESLSNLPEDV